VRALVLDTLDAGGHEEARRWAHACAHAGRPWVVGFLSDRYVLWDGITLPSDQGVHARAWPELAAIAWRYGAPAWSLTGDHRAGNFIARADGVEVAARAVARALWGFRCPAGAARDMAPEEARAWWEAARDAACAIESAALRVAGGGERG